MQSAEIFVVALGYKAPDTIDPKLLDPKYAFEDVEVEEETNAKVTSLKKLITQKPNRSGYADSAGQSLYAETDLSEFMDCADPYEFLRTYNKVFKVNLTGYSSALMLKAESSSRSILLLKTLNSTVKISRSLADLSCSNC